MRRKTYSLLAIVPCVFLLCAHGLGHVEFDRRDDPEHAESSAVPYQSSPTPSRTDEPSRGGSTASKDAKQFSFDAFDRRSSHKRVDNPLTAQSDFERHIGNHLSYQHASYSYSQRPGLSSRDEAWSRSAGKLGESPQNANDGFGDNERQSRKFEAVLDSLVHHGQLLVSNPEYSKHALRFFRAAGALGHTGAMASAAALLGAGNNEIPRDVRNSVRLTQLAASRGQPDAQALLAFLYATGMAERYGLERNEGKALLYWTLAAESGSIFARMALGYRYLVGLGVERSCLKASRQYFVAARAIGTDPRYFPSLENFLAQKPPLPDGLVSSAVQRLDDDSFEWKDGEMHVGSNGDDDNELFEFLRHSANHGDPDALVLMGALRIFGGYGVEPDEDIARELLVEAAELDGGEAPGLLGHLALRRGDNKTALTYFTESAQSGDRVGKYALGMMYLHGVEAARNAATAAFYFQEAVDKEHADAAYQLGMMHWYGNGVKQDAAEAYRFFQHGARLGQIQCKLNLGLMLLNGNYPATEPDCNRGVSYLKEVAESGEWNVLLSAAANRLESGDLFASLYRYLQGAQAGIEISQYNAGLIFEKASAFAEGEVEEVSDDGVTKLRKSPEISHWSRDVMLREALELYDMSAGQGYSPSALRGGDVAYLEVGDYQHAAYAYKKGADLRNAQACHSLGWMYAQGLGVRASRKFATQYLLMASSFASEAVLPSSLTLFAARCAWMIQDLIAFWNAKRAVGREILSRLYSGINRSIDNVEKRYIGSEISFKSLKFSSGTTVASSPDLNKVSSGEKASETRQNRGKISTLVNSDNMLLSGLIGLLMLTILARRMRMRHIDVD